MAGHGCKICDGIFDTPKELIAHNDFTGHLKQWEEAQKTGPSTSEANSGYDVGDTSVGTPKTGPKDKPARKPRSDKGTTRGKKAVSVPPEPKARRSRAKANITEADINGVFQNENHDLYLLKDYKSEPQVTMVSFTDQNEESTGNLSEFASFVRLIPRGGKTK